MVNPERSKLIVWSGTWGAVSRGAVAEQAHGWMRGEALPAAAGPEMGAAAGLAAKQQR